MSSVLFTKLWYYYTPYITICTPFLFATTPLLCLFHNVFIIPRIASRFALSHSYTIFAYRIASALLLCSFLNIFFIIPRIASRFALSHSYTIFAYRIASALLLCSLLWHVNKSLNHLCASTCGL